MLDLSLLPPPPTPRRWLTRWPLPLPLPCLLLLYGAMCCRRWRLPQPPSIYLHFYAVPVAPGRCRVLSRFMTHRPLPGPARVLLDKTQWLGHLGQMDVLDGDSIILAIQVR